MALARPFAGWWVEQPREIHKVQGDMSIRYGKTSDLAGPVRESWLIGNCENRERKVDRGCVNFWYAQQNPRRNLARVCARTSRGGTEGSS